MADVKQTNPSVAFFHPTKSGNGFGVIFEFAPYKGTFFAIYMPEIDGGFSRNTSVTVSIGQTDLGEFLAVLKGMKNGIGPFKDGKYGGVYHNQESRGINTILSFARSEDNDGGFSFSTGVSQKIGNEAPRRAGGRLTVGEAALLLAFFESNMGQYFVAAQENKLRRRNEDRGEAEQAPAEQEAPAAQQKARPPMTAPKTNSKAVQKATADDGGSPF